jgi:ATP-dependent Lon protease
MTGTGRLMLTGSLGDVLRESAQAALSLIRSRADQYNIPKTLFQDCDLHIHFPAGAIPKDGPSAGITIFAALLSLLTKRPCRADVALTGEMTLSGRVLPVSGIREKLLAAQRAGIKKVLLPAMNSEEVTTFEEDITAGLTIIFLEQANDILEHVLTEESPS